MDIKEKYKKYLAEINQCKNEILMYGSTQKCKNRIDECYISLAGQEEELELQLFERKAFLLNDMKYREAINYDTIIMFVSTFVGLVIGFSIDDMAQFIEDIVVRIKKKNLWNHDPMEALVLSINDYKSIVVIIFVIVAFGGMLYYSKNIKKNDTKNVFVSTISQYEIEKIDEILKKYNV